MPTDPIIEEIHAIREAIAKESGYDAEKIAEAARKRQAETMLLKEANAAYAELRSDPEAWQEIQAELAAWETLPDGLPEEEPHAS